MSEITLPPPLPTPPVALTLKTLTVPKERTYFNFVLIISILVWLGLAITIVGLFYAAMFGIMLWFANGLLVAHLRSSAVRVSPDQLPELDATFREVCGRLGRQEAPALYVLQSGGLLNAFATRFAGRDFVVVYSDFLDALGPKSPEMRFILGHEVGHIESRHILKQIALAPGLIAPLAGPAYRRAWETSCDRFGAFASQDVDASVRAMLILSGGHGHGRSLSPQAFSAQYIHDRGFFVSLHELTSTYPTLSRRVTDLIALKQGQPAVSAPRHPLAYLFGLMMPGGSLAQGGPAGAFLVVLVVIGMMAAMAIPAFQKVRQTAQAKMCINQQIMLRSALDQYAMEHNEGVKTWDDVVGPGKLIPKMPVCPDHGTYTANRDQDGMYHVVCSIPGHDPAAALAAPNTPTR